ncbi:MAG: glycosyltransferase family 4 protein [Verrucomicrobia bacterium]|nr:glycosyltransferase family 4 protein [Verrucomicrobiota bacterium]MBI3870624.1 glycosyltransferase family 4 protein [Verrucomicrobiota bacterium]
MIQVSQAVWGKFHHFDLAREFHQRGMLGSIYTTYPSWKLSNEGIPAERIHTFPYLHLASLAAQRLGFRQPGFDRKLARWIIGSFDRYLLRQLDACDVFIGISGAGRKAGEQVQRRGGHYLCDRGSAHIRFCDEILAEEHARWNVPYDPVDPYCLEREEEEYAMADALTVPSSFAASTYRRHGVAPEKIRVIPYGVDLRRFSATQVPPPDRFDVLFVGQISLRKGIPYLLEAFSKLRARGKRLRMAGSMNPEIRELFGRMAGDSVEFLGHVPQARLAALMSASHVLVLPSVEDGFGLVLCQAMACGCPVIASDHTGAPDVIKPGVEGLLFPARHAEVLRQHLQRLADDRPLRDSMGAAALQRVRSFGGWSSYGNAFESLCRERIGMGAGPRHAASPRPTDSNAVPEGPRASTQEHSR